MSNPGNSVSRTHGNYFLMKWMGSYIWDEHGKTNKPMIPMWRQICHGRVWDQPTKVHTMYSLYHFIPTPPGAGKHFFGRRNRPNSAWRRPCFCFYVQQLPWEVRRSKRNGSTTTKNKRHCFVQRCFLSHMNNYYNHPNTLQMSSDCSSDTVFWPSNFESKCLHRGHNLTIQEISLHFKKMSWSSTVFHIVQIICRCCYRHLSAIVYIISGRRGPVGAQIQNCWGALETQQQRCNVAGVASHANLNWWIIQLSSRIIFWYI